MRSRVVLAGGAAIAGLLAFVWWSAGGRSPASVERADQPSSVEVAATFVGRESCAGCHQAEMARWEGSDHDRAMQEAGPSTVKGDFDGARFRYAGVVSRFTTRDGRYIVTTDGPDGELQDYEVAYTFGDYPLQQYLVRFPGGRLQALSLAWDARPRAEGGQRWIHLYPDDPIRAGDVLHWTGPAQNWNAQCAECHSTNLRKGYLASESRYETTWSEIDVSCEACHGPASRHVEWARTWNGRSDDDARRGFTFTLDARDGASWVMDPSTGIARRNRPRSSRSEIETCARCHSRRGALTDDYAYGRPLADTHRPALLEESLYFADGQIQGEVYVYGSFLQSRMYAAGVTCSDCHDPHDLSVGARPDEACARCHLPAAFATPTHHRHEPGSPGASCVNCHMPARTYMVVDPRRDHSFRVPRPDLSEGLGAPNACTSCHTDRSPAWAAARAADWWGTERRPHYGAAIDAGRRLASDAERRLRDLARDGQAPGIARATALTLLGRLLSPLSLDAAAAATRDADPLVRAAAAETLGAADEGSRARLLAPLVSDPVRLVRVTAARAAASLPTGLLTVGQQAARDRGLEEWIASQQAQADTPAAHVNLGVLYAERGEASRARGAYEEALRLQPAFVPAAVNLADLHRAEGRESDAERLLRQALDRAPDQAALHHALGLLLVRTNRTAEAVRALERAERLAPDDPRYAHVLAVAYHSTGRKDEGLALLARSHEAHPGDRETLEALVAYSRESGDRKAALEYARRLAALSPSDPNIRRLLEELQASN